VRAFWLSAVAARPSSKSEVRAFLPFADGILETPAIGSDDIQRIERGDDHHPIDASLPLVQHELDALGVGTLPRRIDDLQPTDLTEVGHVRPATGTVVVVLDLDHPEGID